MGDEGKGFAGSSVFSQASHDVSFQGSSVLDSWRAASSRLIDSRESQATAMLARDWRDWGWSSGRVRLARKVWSLVGVSEERWWR